MICANCKKEVDNDLVFCTECGSRLHETITQTPTVLMNEPLVTNNEIAPPKNSNLKWFVLLAALIALPISIFGVYLLLKMSKQPVSLNANAPQKPTPASTRKTNSNSNSNSNANLANTNVNSNQTDVNITPNSNVNSTQQTKKIIWKERIEITPDSHYAIPFEFTAEGKIFGKVSALQGSPVEGYVYTQQLFDQYFPDHTYKGFSIDGEKSAEVEQNLIKEKYVLVFVNRSESSVILEGEFFAQN